MKLTLRLFINCTVTVVLFACFSSAHSQTLFEENFDAIPDWDSSVGSAPQGWFGYRATPTWAPSTGFPANHEAIEIDSSNSDKARGGSGKSAVFWRESNGGQYRNDKILAYRIPGGARQAYVEFFVKFSPTWTVSGSGADTSKLFRIYAWDEDGSDPPRLYNFFPNGDAGPVFFWNYTQNAQYGQRNFVALRGGPYGENYYMRTPEGFPRRLNNGDSSMNFTQNTVGQGVDGATPSIPDLVNGGFLSDNMNQVVRHEQVFGPPSQERWTKLAFYVQLNSAPGANDGVLIQWLNDEQILNNTNIPWIGPSNNANGVNWDIIAIGGNDYFDRYPATQRYEEWYAIDDLRVLAEIPDNLNEGNEPRIGQCIASPD